MEEQRSFRDEVTEISEDLRHEIQYVRTFCADPALRAAVGRLIDGALDEALAQAATGGQEELDGYFQAGLVLLTYGFYLGREHAKRGYPAPMEAVGVDSGLVPDTLEGLEGFEV